MLQLKLDFSNYSNVVQLRKNNTQYLEPDTKKTVKTCGLNTDTSTPPTPTTKKSTKTPAPKILWYRKFFWRLEVPIAKIREWGGNDSKKGDCRKKATYIKAFAYYTEHYTQKHSSIENVSTPNERAKILADILLTQGIRTEIMCDRFVEIKDGDGKRLDFVYAAEGFFQGPTPKDAAKINKIYGLDILKIINEVEASLIPQSFKSSLPKLKSKSKSKSLSRSPLPKPKSPCNDNLANNLATPNERTKILADTLKAEVCYSEVVEPKSTSANVVSINQVVSRNQKAKILANALKTHGVNARVVSEFFVEILDKNKLSLSRMIADVYIGNSRFLKPLPEQIVALNKIYGVIDILSIIDEVEASFPKIQRADVFTPIERAEFLADFLLAQHGIKTTPDAEFLGILDTDGKIIGNVYSGSTVFISPKPSDAAKINKIYNIDILIAIQYVQERLSELQQFSQSQLKPKLESPLSRSPLPNLHETAIENIESIGTQDKAYEGDTIKITTTLAGENRGKTVVVTRRHNCNFIVYELEGKEYFEQDGGYQILERGVCW